MLQAQASPSDASAPNFQAQKAIIAARFTGMELGVTVHAEGSLKLVAGGATIENDADAKVVGGRVTKGNAVLRYIAGADAGKVGMLRGGVSRAEGGERRVHAPDVCADVFVMCVCVCVAPISHVHAHTVAFPSPPLASPRYLRPPRLHPFRRCAVDRRTRRASTSGSSSATTTWR